MRLAGVYVRNARLILILILILTIDGQLLNQFPLAFEFNSKFLIRIADHSASGWFGELAIPSQAL